MARPSSTDDPDATPGHTTRRVSFQRERSDMYPTFPECLNEEAGSDTLRFAAQPDQPEQFLRDGRINRDQFAQVRA